MGPEDEIYADIFSLLQDRSFVYRANPKPPESTTPMKIIDLNSVDTDKSTSDALDRKRLVIRIQTEFESKIQELRGPCYSTEVRNSGVLVCGIHHSLWDEASDGCANLQQELLAVAQATSAALLSTGSGASSSGFHRILDQGMIAQYRLRFLDIAMNKVQP